MNKKGIESFQKLLQRYVVLMEALNSKRIEKNLQELANVTSQLETETNLDKKEELTNEKEKFLDRTKGFNDTSIVNTASSIDSKKSKYEIANSYFPDHIKKNESTIDIEEGYESGFGRKEGKVQAYISGNDVFSPFGKICISLRVDTKDEYRNVSSNFLHWNGTHNNIIAKWNNTTNLEIDELCISDKNGVIKCTIGVSQLANLTAVENFFNKFRTLCTAFDLLEEKKNVIYTGAPGTGKTYMAKDIAAYLTNNKSYEELSKKEKEQIGFVQFHPSYDYTNFVEGLRTISVGKNIHFIRQDGIFKKFCKEALKEWKLVESKIEPLIGKKIVNEDNISQIVSDVVEKEGEKAFSLEGDHKDVGNADDMSRKKAISQATAKFAKKYVFIIDEINRGELSKIFGELFYSIDPGYRGESGLIDTQYQNLVDFERDAQGNTLDVNGKAIPEGNNSLTPQKDAFKPGFYIPENVYIIGTMNDIDRSVEPMDFAVRRRFVWIPVDPKERTDMWGNVGWYGDALLCMNNVNCVISSIDSLGENYNVGPAYFNNPPLDINGQIIKELLWSLRLYPLIKEYLRILPANDANEKLGYIKKAFDLSDKKLKPGDYDSIKDQLK